MKLIKLTLGVLLLAALLFSTVRMWGENQTYKPFDSVFFRNNSTAPKPLIVVPWEQAFLLEKHPQWILWADVYKVKNEDLLVKPWADRRKGKKDLEQSPSPARPLLKDLLLQFPQTQFVINCNENTMDIHLKLIQVIHETNSTERVLLQSDYNTVLESAKVLEPMIVFGSTPSDLTRLKSYNSLGLLAAAPFKTDVFFAGLTYRNRATLNKEIATELKRRFRKIFLGPIKSKEELEKALEFEPDGLFLEDPFLAPGP